MRDGVWNHQPHDCWLKLLIRRRSKKTSKLSVTSLCEGNSPVTGEFLAQRASNAENVSIWWRHHEISSMEILSINIVTQPFKLLIERTNIKIHTYMQSYLHASVFWGHMIYTCLFNCTINHQITRWEQVTHICVSKLTIIGSDNGLSPGGHQAIILTNAGILLIGP